jgi:hypothetical protein
VFRKSADDYLKVHSLTTTEADVTEGSGGVWERLHYDWSDPEHVVLRTTDSNVWNGASGYTYTFAQLPNGATDVDVVIVREGKNAKGRVRRALARLVRRLHGRRAGRDEAADMSNDPHDQIPIADEERA